MSLLGMARRAGALRIGEEGVREAAGEHRARLILIAADAGDSTARRVRLLEGEKLPVVTLAEDKRVLGAAVGYASAAAVAVCDLGFAAAVAARLAPENPEAERAGAVLAPRQAKALRRKAETARHGKKSAGRKP